MFRTTDAGLLEIIRSLLRASDIPHIVQGEAGVQLFPVGEAGARATHRVTGASVLVSAELADEARAILEATPVADEPEDVE